ncbi:MAG TPA: hypothetical protein VI094_24160 [Propionibacteriaceae bacterium]
MDPPDLADARRWYQQAAEAGDSGAMFNLGYLLANRLDPPDLVQARRWYLRAAGLVTPMPRVVESLNVPGDRAAGWSWRRRRNRAR